MGAAPGEVIFVDDSPQHVAGAKEAGLNACHLADGVEVEALLSEVLKA
jgi:FMN phosphatase YigB (HAD superfamily)